MKRTNESWRMLNEDHEEAEPTSNETTEPASAAGAGAGASSAGSGRSKRRLAWIFGGAGGVVVVAAAVLAFSGVFSPTPPEPSEPLTAPEQTQERARPTARPAPEVTEEPEETPDPTVVVSNVLQMPYSEVWRPADEGQNYWQIVDDAYGYPADGGTDYLLAHSCENRACAGDDLLTLEEGDSLEYQGSQYIVERRWTAMKTDIGDQDIWEHDPNRLVIVTCVIETTWEASDKNEIFVATRLS